MVNNKQIKMSLEEMEVIQETEELLKKFSSLRGIWKNIALIKWENFVKRKKKDKIRKILRNVKEDC